MISRGMQSPEESIQSMMRSYRDEPTCHHLELKVSRAMKILLVSSSFFPKIDGSTRCVYDHARKLVELGNEVYLVTRGMEGARQEETFEGIHIRRSSYSFRGGSLSYKVRLMLEQILVILMLQRKER